MKSLDRRERLNEADGFSLSGLLCGLVSGGGLYVAHSTEWKWQFVVLLQDDGYANTLEDCS